MKEQKLAYEKVYDFTNENVDCLKNLYHFDNSRVLSVVGSGDQFFASVQHGAKKVDLFDINETSYLYFILKFYSIRELTYEEFYEFIIKKKFGNIKIFEKLEKVLPEEVLRYYKYLLINKKRDCFKNDSVNLLSRSNQIHYFKSEFTIIPYLKKNKYYELQEKLKNMKLPKFYKSNILDLKNKLNGNYDIMLASNIYNWISLNIDEYTKLLNNFDIPEIEAYYDWFGFHLKSFMDKKYIINKVITSSPSDYGREKNYIYSLKK